MNDVYMMDVRNFVEDEYKLLIQEISPAKRGFFGETWKIVTEKGSYFIKIDYWECHKALYQRSLPIIEFMTNSGISFIPKILKTKNGALFCNYNHGVMAVFDFVNGENTEEYPIETLFEKLVHVYKLEGNSISIETETFCTEILDKFSRLASDNRLCAQVKEALCDKSEQILQYAKRLQQFSDVCKENKDHFYITHGDAGGNCILNETQFFIIDWDYPVLAPIERDAWFFMCDMEQINKINHVLSKNEIEYELNGHRLCYYCYYSFFYYLTEYLQAILCAPTKAQKINISNSVVEYLTSSWIFVHLKEADKHTL